MYIVSKIRHYLHLDVGVGYGSIHLSQADTHILTLKAVLYRSRSANVFHTFWCKQNTRKRSEILKNQMRFKKGGITVAHSEQEKNMHTLNYFFEHGWSYQTYQMHNHQV